MGLGDKLDIVKNLVKPMKTKTLVLGYFFSHIAIRIRSWKMLARVKFLLAGLQEEKIWDS
jgi:hypothetical protein